MVQLVVMRVILAVHLHQAFGRVVKRIAKAVKLLQPALLRQSSCVGVKRHETCHDDAEEAEPSGHGGGNYLAEYSNGAVLQAAMSATGEHQRRAAQEWARRGYPIA